MGWGLNSSFYKEEFKDILNALILFEKLPIIHNP